MHDHDDPSAAACVLGIECGATRTVILLDDGSPVVRREAGSANIRLLNGSQLIRHFRSIRGMLEGFSAPMSIGLGMAGARTEADREKIRLAASKVWPGVRCYATNDLETAMMAAEPV